MRKFMLFCLCILLFANVSHAEISCVCGQEPCLCFMQLGDAGPEMEYIQHELIEQGYLLQADDAAVFDEKTLNAVMRFQADKNLPATGTLDDDTLTLLLWGMLPEKLDEAKPFSNGRPVWIPTDGGIRRHVKPTCCSMFDPRLVSVRNAELMDMQPCGRCNRDGKNE